MKNDKNCEMGHLKKFISNVCWLSDSNQNLRNLKQVLLYYIYHRYIILQPIIP
jgi:hypothetical protein